LENFREKQPTVSERKDRRINFRPGDAEYLREKIREIDFITPQYSRRVSARVGKKAFSVNIDAALPEYKELRNMIPLEGGRFLNPLDEKYRRRVVFIGNGVEKDLFGEGNGLGKEVYINSVPFLVIGVLKEKIQNSNYNGPDENRIVMPVSTYLGIFGDRYINNMVYKAKDVALTQQLKRRVYEELGKKYKFNPNDTEALAIWDTTEMMKFFNAFFLGFNVFLGIVGSMTLIVGGIGVSNIMNIIVEERTREIGIKKAVGAKTRLILNQYLMETFIITGFGSGLGFFISLLIISVVNKMNIEKYVGVVTLQPNIAIITILLLSAIAFLAGWFPAQKAARMDPVMAIRK